MSLKPFEEVLEPLAFPIAGKTYTPPLLGWEDGMTLLRLTAGIDTEMTSQEPGVLWKMLLGPCFDQMKTDGVPMAAIARAGFAALVDFQTEDRAAAERVWESGIDPELRAALAAAARAKVNADTTTSPSTDEGGSSTKSPASTSGTTRRKPTKPAKRSSGATSSGNGG